MKTLLHFYFLIILSLTLIYSCEKDSDMIINSKETTIDTFLFTKDSFYNYQDQENTFKYLRVESGEFPDDFLSLRNGNLYPIFFRKKSTQDNQNVTNAVRTQFAFNPELIDSITLVRLYTGVISVQMTINNPNGTGATYQPIVNLSVYIRTIKYKDNTIQLDTVLTEPCGAYFKYKPALLPIYTGNKFTYIKVIRTNIGQTYYNYMSGLSKTRWKYTIINSNNETYSDFLNGTTSAGTVHFLNHELQ